MYYNVYELLRMLALLPFPLPVLLSVDVITTQLTSEELPLAENSVFDSVCVLRGNPVHPIA